MKESINFDMVADIYDCYVNADFDVPFFLKETEGFKGPILELMCGTGRVSIPLLNAGRKMTCVDYSKGMLDLFSKKVNGRNYPVDIVRADITNLNLPEKFGMILIPFHSFTEILSAELQYKALTVITQHLEQDGIFILTLQNPETRLKSADGVPRVLGKFPMNLNRQMIISYTNLYNPSDKIASGFQYYEIFDSTNMMIEKRFLEINFRPVWDSELRDMIQELDLEITDTYGDYSYHLFDEDTSDFIIYKMRKK
jgi:Methylase involved in ubiquinone/menaquinone biosynthesis